MKTIKTRAYGKVIVGEITHRTADSIGVRIIKPYSGLSNSDLLFQDLKKDINYESEEGLKAAREILKALYIVCLEVIYCKEKMGIIMEQYERDINCNKLIIWKLESLLAEKRKLYAKEKFLTSYQVTRLDALEQTIIMLIYDTRRMFQTHFSKYFHLKITQSGEVALLDFIKEHTKMDA